MPNATTLGGTAKVTLDADVFETAFNGPLVHEVVVAELAARRRGTHATKTRGMVSGGGAKPWRQKGTGRARAGTSRSPIWTGGGTVFGPSPRKYTVKVNRKARRRALRAALSVHAGRNSIWSIDASTFDSPSTKSAADALDGIDGPGRVLVLVGDEEAICALSFRNIAHATVLPGREAGVADVLGAAHLVVSDAAVEELAAVARESSAKRKEQSAA
jgi:large subunit ribosomal protein L4